MDSELIISKGELCLLDSSGNVEFVWDREDMPRGQYNYMIKHIKSIWHDGWDNFAIWHEALNYWNSLSPETQAVIFNISGCEEREAHKIYTALRMYLNGLEGQENIKKEFEEAIIDVLNSLL